MKTTVKVKHPVTGKKTLLSVTYDYTPAEPATHEEPGVAEEYEVLDVRNTATQTEYPDESVYTDEFIINALKRKHK